MLNARLIRCVAGLDCFCDKRAIHHNKNRGAIAPTHSYQCHCSRKKYGRVCKASLYAFVKGGITFNGNIADASRLHLLTTLERCCLIHHKINVYDSPNKAISG